MASDDAPLAQLVAMGMDSESSRSALAMTDNSLELALDLLLSGAIGGSRGVPPLPPSSPAVPSPYSSSCDEKIEICGLSQYSLGGGAESACTIISLLSALEFLPSKASSPLEAVSAARYEGVIRRGGAMASQGQAHLSADEALLQIPGLKLCGTVLSALITQSGAFEMLIDSGRAAAAATAPTNPYCSIILTKPPESVCLLVPLEPSSERAFYLLDSHARPQLGLDGGYVFTTHSKEALCHRLRDLFPPFPADDLDEYQVGIY